MPAAEQNTRVTKPFDSEHLEELASQSAQVPAERDKPDPRPTSKLHKDEILGLLDMSERLGQASPAPAPAARTAHARLVPAGSTNDAPVTIDDDDDNDRNTQRMQAKHLQAVAEGGLAITPALLESVDWYGETDAAAAAQARTRPRAPEAVLDELGELGGERPVGGVAALASGAPGPELALAPSTDPRLPQAPSTAGRRILISLIGLVLLALVAFVGFAVVT